MGAEGKTGPRELSIARLSTVAPLAACRKTTFYAQADWKQERLGMIETRDLEDHRKRRKPWEMGLSLKGKCVAEMHGTLAHGFVQKSRNMTRTCSG